MENINNYTRVLTETDIILSYLTKEELNKIPNKLREEIKNNKNENYNFIYDEKKSLQEQKILEETKDFIAGIYLTYLCDSEKKNDLISKCKENDKIYEEQLREKYNPDNIFKKEENVTAETGKIENVSEPKALLDYSNLKWYNIVSLKINSFIKKILGIKKGE